MEDSLESLSTAAVKRLQTLTNTITKQLIMYGPNLVLLDTHGIYIPQMYCADLDQHLAECMGVDYQDVQTCQAGPDTEWYWEAWQNILDNAAVVNDGVTWRLHQDGDLWEVPDGYEWPED